MRLDNRPGAKIMAWSFFSELPITSEQYDQLNALMPGMERLGWPTPDAPPPTEEFEVHSMRGPGA